MALEVASSKLVARPTKFNALASQCFIGVSPSGKARDFDSRTRRFKSCHPSHYGPLAQSAEHVTFNHGVPGSNLGWITMPNRICKKYLTYIPSGSNAVGIAMPNRICKKYLTYIPSGSNAVGIIMPNRICKKYLTYIPSGSSAVGITTPNRICKKYLTYIPAGSNAVGITTPNRMPSGSPRQTVFVKNT